MTSWCQTSVQRGLVLPFVSSLRVQFFRLFKHRRLAFLTLISFCCGRSATGEDWHKIMRACYDDAKCDPQVDTEKYGSTCGTTVGAILYFCSFIFLCMFLVSNREENTDRNRWKLYEDKQVSKTQLWYVSKARIRAVRTFSCLSVSLGQKRLRD